MVSGCDRILDRLKSGPATAAELYALGVMVHSRISDLRRRGHDISCEHVSGKTGTDAYVYRLLEAGSGHARRGTTASASSLEQSEPHVSPDSGCSTVPAPEWLGRPAPSPSPGGAAASGTHPNSGTGAGQDSGDTAAGRASWCAAGNGTTCPASPEQLSIEDVLAA